MRETNQSTLYACEPGCAHEGFDLRHGAIFTDYDAAEAFVREREKAAPHEDWNVVELAPTTEGRWEPV